MNKKLKIAAAAVSVVMAGTMAFGVVGCNKGGDDKGGDVTLNINIGDSNQRSISFKYGELLSGTVKLPDGKEYTSASLKPAWAAFEKMVGCKFKDVWANNSNKLTTAATMTVEGSRLQDIDILTDSAANVSTNTEKLLNLTEHLNEMPNYKAFLDANPIIRLSLTSNADGDMYYAPYFDGNNDIEKYNLFKINWVESLLDSADAGDTKTYAQHATAKGVTAAAKIQSVMGTTGDWSVDVLDKDGNKIANGLKVNYTAVKTALSDNNSGLYGAYRQAAGADYSGDSGNIVDIMNAAITATEGAVTGAGLRKLLQEYIKVAYQTATGASFYGQTGYKLSDVFCGYSAGWDVDLYAALGRVLVTNPCLLKSGKDGNSIGGTGATAWDKLYLHVARETGMQRQSDTVSMIGQLYGVRGLESKNLWTYIGSDGNVKFAPNDEASYEAMNKFHAFVEEGLIAVGINVSDKGVSSKKGEVVDGKDGSQSFYKDKTVEALTTYDYVNTQTPAGFQIQKDPSDSSKTVVTGKYSLESTYNYGPVITPVANWNDGSAKKMRFTESWRTTKDTGFCVPKTVANNQKKLKAVLKFIDTMFSSEGQIVLTYGPMASSADAKDGFWYNREATPEEVTAGTYFQFGDKKLWSDVQYGGVYQPKILDDVYKAYYGQQVNAIKFDGSGADYVGEKVKDVDKNNDTKVSKDKTTPEAVKVINRDGQFVDLPKGSKVENECYIVEKDGTKYLVTDKGMPVGEKGYQIMKSSANGWAVAATLNYTNFARYVIGSALPIGNKLQSFEFQLTSEMGRSRALYVDKALGSPSDPTDGVISHTVNSVTTNKWYTVIPTTLPYSEEDATELKKYSKLNLGDDGNPFSNNKNAASNVYYDIVIKGYDKTTLNGDKTGGKYGYMFETATAAGIIATLNAGTTPMSTYITIKNDALKVALKYYTENLAG